MPRSRTKPQDILDFDFTPMADRRRLARLSLPQLAQVAGIHWVTLWRTEQGRRDPSLAEMTLIARALGTPIYNLFNVREK